MIAFLYGRGGFPLVLGTTVFVALAFLIAVLAISHSVLPKDHAVVQQPPVLVALLVTVIWGTGAYTLYSYLALYLTRRSAP